MNRSRVNIKARISIGEDIVKLLPILLINKHYNVAVSFSNIDRMKLPTIEADITFSADLDPVPGWGDSPEDWVTLFKDHAENCPTQIHSLTFEVV